MSRSLGGTSISKSAFDSIFSFPNGSNYALSGFSGNSRHMSHGGGTNRGDSIACLVNKDKRFGAAIYSNVAQNELVNSLAQSLYDWFVTVVARS